MENQEMSTENLVRQLHDSATRGATLSADQQAELDAWYAEHDRAESQLLGLADIQLSPVDLRAQVEEAFNRLLKTAQQVQEITAQNDALRREIGELQRRLVQPLST